MSRPVVDQDTHPWRDPSRPAAERVADLLGRMTLEEKVAQLTSLWLGRQPRDSNVAPMQGEFRAPEAPLAELIQDGLGQLTRVFGTRPVPPADAVRTLRELQAQIVAASRFGIPAVAHEECLTGFAAWTATIFPTPLAWGASFDPGLVGEMAAAIGASMRAVGVHQGLSPVLDVTRDARWGRVEETIGEDPYLVGSVGTAYVRGLQSAGVQATLKHFAGYSASRAGRNLAPVAIGRREFADVILVPFEMALRRRGAVGDAVLHRHRRGPGVGRPRTADHAAAGRARFRRPGRLGLLRDRVPADPARGGRHARAGRRAGPGGGPGRRAAQRRLLRLRAGQRGAGRPGADGARRPGRGPGAAAEV